jgi:hypothetical protein
MPSDAQLAANHLNALKSTVSAHSRRQGPLRAQCL